MNQSTSDRKDKTGGDVTKAELMTTPTVEPTKWDTLSNTGSMESTNPSK